MLNVNDMNRVHSLEVGYYLKHKINYTNLPNNTSSTSTPDNTAYPRNVPDPSPYIANQKIIFALKTTLAYDILRQ